MKVSRNAAIVVGGAFALLVIIGLLVVFVLKPFTPPDINIPLPDGWKEVSGVELETMEKGMEGVYEGMALDAYYTEALSGDIIVAIHFKTRGAQNAPPDDASMSEMEDYIAENRGSLESEFLGGIGSIDADVLSIEAEELQSGGAAIRIKVAMANPSVYGGSGMGMNILILSKKGTSYMVMLFSMAAGTADKNLDFLKQNITFSKP